LASPGRYGGRVAIATANLAEAAWSAEPKPFLLALDCWANALAGGNPTEWLSSRAANARARWRADVDTPADRRAYLWGCVLCRVLDAIKANHCADSLQADKAK
jgi:hypothetical protein